MKQRMYALLPACAALALILVSCAGGNSSPSQTPEATAPPGPAVVTNEELLAAYSNNLYDYSFTPLELQEPSAYLDEWIRPVMPAIFAPNGAIAGTFKIRGPAIMCGKYVIAASGPFQVAEPPGDEFTMGGVLIWDIVETAEGNVLETENLKIVEEIVIEGYDVGIIILERSPGTRFPMPPPGTCPYVIGNSGELKPLHALLVVGHTKGKNTGQLLMPWRKGHVTAVDTETDTIFFSSSTWLHDWGSPLFALRDGNPELVGLTISASLAQGWETREFAIPIEKVLEVIKEKTGITFTGIPRKTPPSTVSPERISFIRAEITSSLAATYYIRSLQALDLEDVFVSTEFANECVQNVHVRVIDDQGKVVAQKDLKGLVLGSYLIISRVLLPQFPDTNTPSPPRPPDMTDEEYAIFLKEWEELRERFAQFRYEAFLMWKGEKNTVSLELTNPVTFTRSKDEAFFREHMLMVFERVPTFSATGEQKQYPVCAISVGSRKNLAPGTLLVTAGSRTNVKDHDMAAISVASYVGAANDPDSFFLQGSTIFQELGFPVFALNSSTNSFELIGILVGTRDPLETRATVLDISKIIEVLNENNSSGEEEGGSE